AEEVPVLSSIKNDREFERLCHGVLDRPGLEKDPDYATNQARNARRDDTNAIVQKSFGSQSFEGLAARLDAAQIAWARVSAVTDLSVHPQLRRVAFGTAKGDVSMPASASGWATCPRWDNTRRRSGASSRRRCLRRRPKGDAALADRRPALRLRRRLLLRRGRAHELLAGVAARPWRAGCRDRHALHD